MSRAWLLLAVGLLALVPMGCGSPPPNPITGQVTLDGQPLTDASITFIPTGETVGDAAHGRTGPDGTYELEARDGKGLAPGQYKVVISKWLRPDGTPPPPDVPPIDSDAKETIHPNYSDVERTVLRATVSEGGGKIDFPLSKSGKKP
jgi:hypothetical protein